MSFGILVETSSGTVNLADVSVASLVAKHKVTTLSGTYTPPSNWNVSFGQYFYLVNSITRYQRVLIQYNQSQNRFEWSFPSGTTLDIDILLLRVV